LAPTAPSGDGPAVGSPALLSSAIGARTGDVGTRNEIWILTTVGCVNRTARAHRARAHERYAAAVDGVHAFNASIRLFTARHDLGRTRHLIGALANHPNAAAS